MRNARYLVLGSVVLAVVLAAVLVSGCAKRQLTRSETDRLGAIAAKIAEAERIGAPDCVPPRELAKAKVALEHAQHELVEHWERAEPDVREAEAAADDLLKKTRDCVEGRKPAPVPTPAAAPAPAPALPPPPEPAPAPAPVPAPVPVPAPAPEPAVRESSLESIHFDFDKSFIREDAKPLLRKVFDYLSEHRDATIRIEGNCDERGTPEYNMALGDRRAAAARKYLAGLGVDGKRLSTLSYGKERPVCRESDEACWQRNRRVDFVPLK